MKLHEHIQVLPSERMFIVGKTGSGKSILARELLSGYPHVYVYDAKGDFRIGEHDRIITSPSQFSELDLRDRSPVIYRPSVEFYNNMDANDAIFEWLYRRKNCTLYIDELSSVISPSGQPPQYLQFILTRGRSLNIRTITSTQRPRKIPMSLLSESEHVAMFRMSLRDDRKFVSEVAESEEVLPSPIGHSYYYCKSGNIELCELDNVK